jgi:Tfp pilus assembly protein PilF
MPGIEQLKKFNKSITALGNEIARRKERGETMPEVSIPDNVPQEDDSLEFEFGVPEAEPAKTEEQSDLQEQNSTETTTDIPETVPDIEDLFDPGDIDDSIFEDLPPITTAEDEDHETTDDEYNISAEDTETNENTESIDKNDNINDAINDLFSTADASDLKLTDEEASSLENAGIDSDFDSDDFSELSLNSELETPFNEGEAPSTEKPTENLVPDISDINLSSEENVAENVEENIPVEDFGLSDIKIPDISDLEFKDDSDTAETDSSAKKDDFENSFDEDEFVIPGFSDKEYAKPTNRKLIVTEEGEELLPNTITDKQYKRFKKNLLYYPLNLRLEIEKFIVNNEFKDEAVMNVISKVIKKDTARHLASHLEKLLDISIPVPMNYERRTVEEYNVYKQSLEFQLKNRIIPGAIGAAAIILATLILFFLGNRFLYKPIRAEILYNQGYSLIQNSEYEQSELKFDKAVSFKPKKRWYFKYARSYSDQKQYERASSIYERLLRRFNYDKKAGIEYARMEFEKLQNYEKADSITRNYILDYHINDKDGELLLGDINLEWGDYSTTAQEKAKHYETARLQYADLMEQYGQKDLYLSRMLRYFIRTDNLREVLPLKEYFMGQKKIPLEPRDLVEMGGYLLQKLFGYLSPADEYLREYITNVRRILETAVRADPTMPEAHYNLGVYFQHDYKPDMALSSFDNALVMFDKTEKRNFARILKNIDTYRREGEIYTAKQEYLTAEQKISQGITMFENEQSVNQLESDKDVGKLYSDLADINYFISGDLPIALQNYKNAIDNKYDSPSNRYKIGYIQYVNKNYKEALGSFIQASNSEPENRNLLMAMGNVLAIRNDDYASSGYYGQLIDILDKAISQESIILPQVNPNQADLVDVYMKASNNLGVVQNRLAERTGNSSLRAQAMIQFSESQRAWDALTRNQETMVRLDGSNLAAQNSKYMNMKSSNYEPSIYTDIPSVLAGDTVLKQSSVE